MFMLMDASPSDPFDVLGLRPTFDLSAAEIDRAFLARMGRAHPDHHATPADPETDIAHLAGELNRARSILSDAETRAQALLSRLGGRRKEDDRALPEGFLVQMMETRSTIDEERAELAGEPGDVTAKERQSEAFLDRWETWGDARRQQHIDAVRSHFASLSGPPDPSVLRRIRTELNAWRYIERLLEQLRN